MLGFFSAAMLSFLLTVFYLPLFVALGVGQHLFLGLHSLSPAKHRFGSLLLSRFVSHHRFWTAF